VSRLATDVLIVGGGPAGLYAGRLLAAAGHRVDLVEEHREIGTPVHCTGVLAREAFTRFDLASSSLLNELKTVQFVAPSGSRVEYSTATTEAVVIDRRRFDRQLADEAIAAGVRVHNARVTTVTRGAAGMTVVAGDQRFAARSVLLACGASYGLQKQLGLGLPRLLLRSAQAELPADRLRDVEVHFGSAVAPHGFAWAVPVHRAERA
jgi:flavin-dependent dehydrogenase